MILVVFVKFIFMVFFMLLPLANPLIPVTIMMSVGSRLAHEEKMKQARQTGVYSFTIMVVSFYFGHLVMNFFGISIPGLRIAGGLIVLIIGFQMLFPQQGDAPELESKKDEVKNRAVTNLAFIPLTMPGFAGPGVIAMLISIASTLSSFDAPRWVQLTAPIFSFILLCGLLVLCLKRSDFIMTKLGQSGIEAISRLMGFLLVCMGVQFCVDGVLEVVAGASKTLSSLPVVN